MLPAGLKNSTFAITLASRFSSFSRFVNSTSGVFPINSVIFEYIIYDSSFINNVGTVFSLYCVEMIPESLNLEYTPANLPS